MAIIFGALPYTLGKRTALAGTKVIDLEVSVLSKAD